MGKPTGFLEYERRVSEEIAPLERIKNFNEFHIPLPLEKQQLQGARCMACGVPFCQYGKMINGMASGCPLNNLCPEWNDLVYTGNWEQAYNRLMKTHCFPEFTSRVCPALCEAACTCNLNGDPVSTKENERAIIERAYETGLVKAQPPKVRTGKKVAVIDRRVRLMEEEGVIFKTNVNVGVDVKAAKLLKDFDRVVLCCGASNPRDIKVPGREAEGIYFAVDFLKGVTKSLLDSDLADQKFVACKNKKVMVIGGGDTGNDCVGTAIRLGASSVVQLEMMPKAPDQRAANNPWPEWPRVCKTDYGQQEAIAVFGHDPRIYQTTVKEFIADDKGRLKKAVLVKLQSKKDEKTGRMMMVPVEGSEWTVEVDVVLIAAGFLGSQKYVTDAFKVDLTPRTNVATEAEKYQTSVKNVFTAGDMHRGQSLVVWAIHEGREAAKAVDESLMGYTNLV